MYRYRFLKMAFYVPVRLKSVAKLAGVGTVRVRSNTVFKCITGHLGNFFQRNFLRNKYRYLYPVPSTQYPVPSTGPVLSGPAVGHGDPNIHSKITRTTSKCRRRWGWWRWRGPRRPPRWWSPSGRFHPAQPTTGEINIYIYRWQGPRRPPRWWSLSGRFHPDQPTSGRKIYTVPT